MRTVIGRIGSYVGMILAVIAFFVLLIFAGEGLRGRLWWVPMLVSACASTFFMAVAYVMEHLVGELAMLFAARNLVRILFYKMGSRSEKSQMVYLTWEANDYVISDTFNELYEMYIEAEEENYEELRERYRGN